MNRTTPTPIRKTCPKCNEVKDATAFNKHSDHRDKLSTSCKECGKNYLRENRALKRAIKKAAQGHPNDPKVPPISTITPSPKSVRSDTPELVVDVPGIYEVQNRGKGYTSFRFESPIDGSVFSFPSFQDARKVRKSMLAVFEQQARFESVHRQSTGGRPAVDSDED